MKEELTEHAFTTLTDIQKSELKGGPLTDPTPGMPFGVDKAKPGEDFPKFFTPSLFKMPMHKAKNERRILDYQDFLHRIHYQTHNSTEQRGHGQNLTGK